MVYQVLVKNLFNDMFAFFNGKQTMDLKTLAETYPDEPLLRAFISGLDQALSVPYNDVMKQCITEENCPKRNGGTLLTASDL